MKKKYESPKVEKYEFNYVENVTASGLRTDDEPVTEPAIKEGSNINGCYTGANASKGCTPSY